MANERTSKKYKGHMVFATLLFCVGVALFIVGAEGQKKGAEISGTSMAGMITGLLGFVWFAAAKYSAWWNHG
jgi:hypothetical protein